MKKLFIIIGLLPCLVLAVFYFSDVCCRIENNHFDAMEENTELREQYFNKLLADPSTGKIPDHMRMLELAFDKTLPVFNDPKRSEQWTARGPNNLGGRTRAIGININNPSEMLAGAVTGGIFKSTDGGKSWNTTQCPLLSITCLVQDQRPGKTDIWYAGTGELSGSSGTATGAYYLGAGILKSTDGGNTWNVLASTAGNSPVVFDKEFDGVWNIVVDNSNLTEDEIYAATYGSIYRSVNGGTTWSLKLAGGLTVSYNTDVAISASGVVYATLSSDGSKKGIWRSPDGITWTNITPTGFPAIYGRNVIGVAPSDEKQVYFLVAGTNNSGLMSVNFQGDKEWNSFWKYEFVSGNGAGNGGKWTDRSLNLPEKGGDFGHFNTQGGYDLYVRVKPDDANTVFIGAANLWRSTDGFATDGYTSWIGGYGVNTSRPDFKLYSNHHPDNHNFIFYPGSTSKVFSTHDGGISLTENIMASPVNWTSMNNNYITTQFYTVAIDHSVSMDNKIVGGLQDNGTQFLNQSGLNSWQMSFNGDGAYCFLKDGSNEIYASAQQGRMGHLELDAAGIPVKYARIDPMQLSRSDYDFINPFSIDPNNQKICYLPAKKRLFRNVNIDAKPLTAAFDSTRWNTPLWEELTNCVPSAGEFSAIVTSKCNPNTVYYATDAGKLFRVNNANTGQPIPVNITGNNFSTGNINCIALDPLDSNKIMVVFSNYGIVSLFSTEDGGKNWTDVSGNLEETPSGTGAGPSCRWAAVMPLQNGKRIWFVGTSTGLFASSNLSAKPVVWLKQSPGTIGSVIVSMIEVRPQDNYIVVATHGAGVFSANIYNEWQTTSLAKADNTFKFKSYPNPLTGTHFTVNFSNPLTELPSFSLFSLSGKKLALSISENNLMQSYSLRFETETLASGNYWLVMKSGNQEWTEKIVVVK